MSAVTEEDEARPKLSCFEAIAADHPVLTEPSGLIIRDRITAKMLVLASAPFRA